MGWWRSGERPRRHLTDFKQICEIDLNLRKSTIDGHVRHIGEYINFCERNGIEVESQESIRQFLRPLKDGNQSTYGNHVKSIRVFFRECLKSDMAKSFKIPRYSQDYVKVPTREELRRFYDALPNQRFKALALFYATSGKRRRELLDARMESVDFEKMMIVPANGGSSTKNEWFTFFNDEALEAYRKYRDGENGHDGKLFNGVSHVNRVFKETSGKVGIMKITPQVLREWFCQEMGELKVPDRFVDAFCGRVPKSVLGRRYSDYSPERLKKIYDNAGLEVLS